MSFMGNKKAVFGVLVTLGCLLAGGLAIQGRADQNGKIIGYRDPMDPKIVSKTFKKDSMGMPYLPIYAADSGAGNQSKGDGQGSSGSTATNANGSEKKIIGYRDPMDPKIVSKTFKKDSMGMPYIAIYASNEGLGESAGPAVSGLAGFSLDERQQQLIGVRWSEAGEMELEKTVRMGARVGQGGQILAELLEIDAGTLKPGFKAEVKGPWGASVEGRVTSVGHSLDGITRSFEVTLAVMTHPAWMAPGVFCEADALVPLGRRLAVPQDAVLDTGERQVVFVVQGNGYFQPRQVVTGVSGDNDVEILSGIKAGENVVTSANFLIDSESQFQEALQKF